MTGVLGQQDTSLLHLFSLLAAGTENNVCNAKLSKHNHTLRSWTGLRGVLKLKHLRWKLLYALLCLDYY